MAAAIPFFALVTVTRATVIVAQEISDPGASTTWLIDLVTNIGIGGIFVWIWYDERKERRQAQAKVNDLMERIIPALTDSTATLERVQDSMARVTEAQGESRKHDLSSLQQAVTALTQELHGRPPPRRGG